MNFHLPNKINVLICNEYHRSWFDVTRLHVSVGARYSDSSHQTTVGCPQRCSGNEQRTFLMDSGVGVADAHWILKLFFCAGSFFEDLDETLTFIDGSADLIQCFVGLEVARDNVIRPTMMLNDVFVVTTTFRGQTSTFEAGQIVLTDSTGKPGKKYMFGTYIYRAQVLIFTCIANQVIMICPLRK